MGEDGEGGGGWAGKSMTGGLSLTGLPTLSTPFVDNIQIRSNKMRDVPVSWLSLLITNRHVLVRWCQDWGFCSPPCSPELTLSLDWYSVLEGSDGTIVYSYNPVLQILVNKQYWSYEKIWPTHTWLLTAQCTLITRTPQIEPIEANRLCLVLTILLRLDILCWQK